MFAIRGVVASVRWGYHRAADLRAWTITRDRRDKTVFHFRGQVVRADPFLGARSELVLVVPLKGGRAWWQWPVRELAIANGQARATLGPVLDDQGGVRLAARAGGIRV
jgi:hypothetical protein